MTLRHHQLQRGMDVSPPQTELNMAPAAEPTNLSICLVGHRHTLAAAALHWPTHNCCPYAPLTGTSARPCCMPEAPRHTPPAHATALTHPPTYPPTQPPDIHPPPTFAPHPRFHRLVSSQPRIILGTASSSRRWVMDQLAKDYPFSYEVVKAAIDEKVGMGQLP